MSFALLFGSVLVSAGEARAAGLYYLDRGVRPLSRAGSFIAGGDDLGAIAYNPAGIYDAGAQVLLDASWVHFRSEYTRQALVTQVDPNTQTPVGSSVRTFPEVQGTGPFLPIPTVAGSFKPHRQWVVGIGVWAPYAVLSNYPDPDDLKGKSSREIENGAPQRYSLISLNGSALAILSATAAFAPNKHLRLGASVGMLTGKFQSLINFSGCVPERFLCAPEDPAWDVRAELSAGPIISPYGQLGLVWIPSPTWRVGLASQLPIYVRTGASIKTRLPGTPVFERAVQRGEDADVAFDLPWNIKAGIEGRFVRNLRVEAGFAFERWSMHDKIEVTPRGVNLENIALFPKQYFIPPVTLKRGFQDSASVRVGGEYTFQAGGLTWDGRAGISYESSGIPKQNISVLTPDSNKITVALGGSVHVGKWRFDMTYAHIFAFDVTVEPNEAQIPQVSPVRSNPPKRPNYINGGLYSGRADVFGLGLAYTFDPAPVDNTPQGPAPASNVSVPR